MYLGKEAGAFFDFAEHNKTYIFGGIKRDKGQRRTTSKLFSEERKTYMEKTGKQLVAGIEHFNQIP